MDRETLEIVRAFVIESLDSLDEQEGKIQGILESGSKESINAIFRVFHTIKGLSGFLNFNTINTVTHEAETLLDLLRNKPETISEDIIDVVYESFDVLRTLLNTVASVMKDTGNEEIVRALIARLQLVIHAIKTGTPLQPSAQSSQKSSPVEQPLPQNNAVPAGFQLDAPDKAFANLDIDNMSEEELDASMAAIFDSEVQNIATVSANSDTASFSDDFFFTEEQLSTLENSFHSDTKPITASQSADLPQHTEEFSDASLPAIAPDILQRYITEALELITTAEDGCLSLEQNPHDMTVVGAIFGAVHSLKGNSGFMGFAEIEGMSMDLENILDAVRAKTLEVYPGLISMLLTNIDIIKGAVNELARQQNMALPTAKKSKSSGVSAVSQQSVNASGQIRAKEVEHMPDEQFLQKMWEGTEQNVEEKSSGRVSANAQPIDSNTEAKTLVTSRVQSESNSEFKPESKSDTKSEGKSDSNTALIQRRDIRVDMDKLDKLFDLVGELITIESMVTSNPEVQALELESFNKAAAMLNKITRELQEVTMSIRMMPLEGLFNKMKRLVRDLSIRFDKKINLEIGGAETEMDKNVIEEISDPLMHIIRNAIDHGIESRERRLNAGKTEIGTVKLQARYEGNEILIIIEDDGGGINRAKIIEKAQSKGILKTSPDKMTDREVNALIFEPGFSTAEKITDISGRGVGMDVVKRNIEKLQGSITVDTREGKGTRFTLRIPLTLAIMDAMMIRVGSSIYALPILAIRESFRPQQQAITITMDGQEVVRVREELFAVLRLHEIYDRIPDTTLLHEGILIIVESRERKACVFVDEILGQQQIVVKNLSDYVGNVEGITGCMIQSNGEVGLIIDVDALLQQMSGIGSMMAAHE